MIRTYQDKDLKGLLKAWYSASKVGHPFLSEQFFKQERENIVEVYIPSAETYVYDVKGNIAGFISLIGDEVGAIFVDAQFQGQGIGKALMDHARSMRNTLELNVFKDNRVGRQFYEKYGFKTLGEHLHKETGFMQLRLRLNCK